eukprot:1069277-Amphidinium_carterae.2
MWPSTGGRGARQRVARAPPQLTLRAPTTSANEDTRPTYLDVPPAWDGTDAENSLEGYIRAVEAWLKTTRVPVQQRGVQLLAQTDGELRSLLSTLDLDLITEKDGGEQVLDFVRKQFEWVLVRSLPRLFEEAVYSQAGQRLKTESFVTCTARKTLLFQKLAKEGCPLHPLARGIVMLNHAHLRRHDSDFVFTWLVADYEADKVCDCLCKLDRPQHGTSGTAPTVLYDGVDNDDEAWTADGQQWQGQQPGWSEWEGADQEWLPEEDDQFWAALPPEYQDGEIAEEYTEEEALSALNEVYAVTYPQVRQAMAQDRLGTGLLFSPIFHVIGFDLVQGQRKTEFKGKPPWLERWVVIPEKAA